MSITYPGTIDTFTTISPGTTQDIAVGGRQHLDMHNDADAAVVALETKVGAGANNQTPSGGAVLTALTDGTTEWLDRLTPTLLPNGEFRIDQLPGPYTSTGSRNNDDSYTIDLINLLSDGNNIVSVTQETSDVPTGAKAACKLICTTANKKAGIAMFLTAEQSSEIIGGVASLSFEAHTTTAKVVNNLRAAILSWSGTADAITSDVVSGTSWGSSGTNPTLATSWTMENTPSNLALSTSYQTFKIENVAIDTASAKNVAVFIWIDDTDMAISDEVFIADVHLEPGKVTHGLKRTTRREALAACLEQWWVIGGAEDGNGGNVLARATGYIQSSTTARLFFPFPVVMRTVPTFVKSGNWAVVDSTDTAFASSSETLAIVTSKAVARVDMTISGATANRPCWWVMNADTTARAMFDARL